MRKSDIRRGDFVKIANGTWYEAVHRDGGIKLVGLKTSDTPICYQPKNIKCSAGGGQICSSIKR